MFLKWHSTDKTVGGVVRSLGNVLKSVCFYGHFKKESGTFALVTEPCCEISLIEFAFCSHRLLAPSDHLGAL